MSITNTKSILLSQQKVGQIVEAVALPTLTHTKTTEPGKKEGETSTVYKVEIPGVDPSTVSIECENFTLLISCDRGTLTVPLTPTTDPASITADILWGMLTIVIPQPVPPTAQSIRVSIHDAVKKTASKPAQSLQDKE